MTLGDEAPATSTEDDGARAQWSRLAVLGLVSVALGPFLILAAGLASGAGFDAFFLIVMAVAAIGAFLASRRAPVARIIAAVLAFLAGGSMFWTAFGLFSPNSFFDFVPGVLVLPGALLAIVSCIASVVAQRRGHLAAAPTGGERRGLRIAIGVAAVLALLSAVVTLTGKSTADSSKAGARVAMADFKFSPEDVQVKAGTVVLVKNTDPFIHSFTVDTFDIDEYIGPGSSKLITIPATATGSFVFYCEPHTEDSKDPGEDDMAGTMTIG
jgi:plastocyanin